MIIHPEFSRRVPVSRIGIGGLDQTIEASSAECRALAERLQLPAVASFSCRFRLAPPRQRQVMAEAELRAEVTQVCVVSMEPFEATVSERFTLRFVPETASKTLGDTPADGLEDHDIDPSLPDELTYADDAIDIGEAASEQLALALDPYPRMPGIALPEFDGGVPVDQEPVDHDPAGTAADPPHPFAALVRLRGGPRSGGSRE